MARTHNSSESGTPVAETGGPAAHRSGFEELGARAGRAVLRVAAGIRWYMTSLMGDNAYATYLAHHRRTHPDAQPLSERQFWRQRMDDQDRNPGARCC